MPKVAGYQWPMATLVLIIVYAAVLIVYLGWPVTAISTPPERWPFLSFIVSASILKTVLPMAVVLLSVLKLTAPGILWGLLIYILAMLGDSVCLLTLMAYYAIFSNTASSASSFGNDPLYCCKFFGLTPNCLASYGPCSTTPVLALNSDVWLLMIFAGILTLLEIMAFFFVNRMYDYYKRLYERQKSTQFPTASNTKQTSQIGPSLLPNKLQIPFFTTTLPRFWSEMQKHLDGLILMDDSHITMAQKYANMKKEN